MRYIWQKIAVSRIQLKTLAVPITLYSSLRMISVILILHNLHPLNRVHADHNANAFLPITEYISVTQYTFPASVSSLTPFSALSTLSIDHPVPGIPAITVIKFFIPSQELLI